jgi:predicted phosphodiesterase
MAKYLRCGSDLHLEAWLGQDATKLADFFLPEDPRDAESILILAGDISSHLDQLTGFLSVLVKRFERVLYVPGNHEFYRHHFEDQCRKMEAALSPLADDGLAFATDGVSNRVHDGVRFIFTTLWADGGPTLEDQAKTGYCLNDFRLITTGDPARRFTVSDMKGQFRRSKAELRTQLEAPWAGKTVVITHHLPSRRLVSARFWPGDGSDGSNGGFVGQCDDLLAGDHAPALWIHGHTHDTIDTRLWKTRVVCNPAGYRGEWSTEHNTFMRVEGQQRVVNPCFIDLSEL